MMSADPTVVGEGDCLIYIYIYIWGEGSLGSLVGGSGACACVIFLRECIWNAPMTSLVLSAFDDTGSLGSSLHQVVIRLFEWLHPGLLPPVSLQRIRRLS